MYLYPFTSRAIPPHENVLHFIGTVLSPRLGIVTEFCANGSLKSYQETHSEALDVKWILPKLLGIAKGSFILQSYLKFERDSSFASK